MFCFSDCHFDIKLIVYFGPLGLLLIGKGRWDVVWNFELEGYFVVISLQTTVSQIFYLELLCDYRTRCLNHFASLSFTLRIVDVLKSVEKELQMFNSYFLLYIKQHEAIQHVFCFVDLTR